MQLNDAQQMAEENPSTFEAPSSAQLEQIDVGYVVKVSNNYDRFWIRVTGVEGEKLTGKIENDLVGPVGKFGDEIAFERRHVYSFHGGS